MILKAKYIRFTAIALTIGGALFFIISLIVISNGHNITWSNIDSEESSQIGSFIGGILGPVWSLASVLFFYVALVLQRKEFKLQRKELKKTREEFQTNRITSILYNQLSRIDEVIKDFKIDDKVGYAAVTLMRSHFRSNDQDDDINEEIKIIHHNITQIRGYIKVLFPFINRIDDNVAAIDFVINESKLDLKDKNQFRSLININVGADFIEILEFIKHYVNAYFKVEGMDEGAAFENFPNLYLLSAASSNILKRIMISE